MTSAVDSDQQRRQEAAQIVERFVRRFDESYRLLAYHAALPLVLTPELVNYLRNRFLRGKEVPWVAEVDLLLSELCRPVGYELYVMDTAVRAYLLESIKDDPEWQQRMREVAQVLISYVSYLSQISPGRRPELEAQRWAAMMYLGDEECLAAAEEIAERLQSSGSAMSSANGAASGLRAELARLTRITQELAPQLQAHQSLVEYARVVQQVLKRPESVNLEEVQASYRFGDRELRVPEPIVPTYLIEAVHLTVAGQGTMVGFPPLRTFDFGVAMVTVEPETTKPDSSSTPDIVLHPFSFEVATIELRQRGGLGRLFGRTGPPELVIRKQQRQAQQFIQQLGDGIVLELVSIPGGKFLMGAPKNEEESSNDERPRHQVTVQPFLIGKYPVTQAQWRAVAALPQVNRKLDPAPARYKGDDRPVEQVNWYEAVEFCDRLAQHTNRPYRLPSEAEWEYACRAGTTTAFHFGETIAPELANYHTEVSYRDSPTKKSREETTPVGSFGVANNFGLYDMHGNVWEWCMDHWHGSYEGAPTDGSAWLSDDDNANRVLRGGSWYSNPLYCRSAFRFNVNPDGRDDIYNDIGFRVVCSAPRTQ